MDTILHQLGGLILGSVPTMLLFVILVVAYGFLVRRPLDAVLAERRKRTTGAIEQARGQMSAAEAEASVFEDKLRNARAEMLAARARRLAAWNAERERMLQEARLETSTKIQAARLELEQSANAARSQIEGASAELSAKILRAVLPAGHSAASTEVAQ